MTRKLLLSIIGAVFAIGILGTISSGVNTDEKTNPETSQMVVPYLAFAEKPVQTIESADISETDYGSGSTFDIDKVECKISTQNGITKVLWCKASGIMNKIDFATCLADPNACFGAFGSILQAVFEAGPDFDKVLVNWEVEQLTDTINTILTDKGYVVPADYSAKSVDLKMSVQNNTGSETSQTEVVVGIEY